MSHVREHCSKPRWRAGRFRHTPWVCDCGKAWLSYQEFDGPDLTRTAWREWTGPSAPVKDEHV